MYRIKHKTFINVYQVNTSHFFAISIKHDNIKKKMITKVLNGIKKNLKRHLVIVSHLLKIKMRFIVDANYI